MTSLQTALNLRHVILEPMTDETSNMFDVVQRFQAGALQKPLHQRDRCWPDSKICSWVTTLRERVKPVGCICTYQLDNGQPSPIYLNDGLQRTLASLEYLIEPEKFGDSLETAEQYLRAFKMPVQHRHYRTHEEAMRWFQRLNIGTAMTTYEFCHGILTYMDNYETHWAPLIHELHKAMERIPSDFVNYGTSRKSRHKRLRSDLALLLRFLANSREKRQYDTSVGKVDIERIGEKNSVETNLRKQLECIGPSEARRQLLRFIQLIERETALIRDSWSNQLGHRDRVINETCYRWLLDVAIYKRITGAPHGVWEDFVVKLLHRTNGSSVLLELDETGSLTRRRITLGLSRLDRLKGACDFVGSRLYDVTETPTQRKKANAAPGYDESHLLPFTEHGDGPTIIEPAGRNRARGARPIEQQP